MPVSFIVNLLLKISHFFRETMIDHLEIDSNIVHRDSPQGKLQIKAELEKSRSLQFFRYQNVYV